MVRRKKKDVLGRCTDKLYSIPECNRWLNCITCFDLWQSLLINIVFFKKIKKIN